MIQIFVRSDLMDLSCKRNSIFESGDNGGVMNCAAPFEPWTIIKLDDTLKNVSGFGGIKYKHILISVNSSKSIGIRRIYNQYFYSVLIFFD